MRRAMNNFAVKLLLISALFAPMLITGGASAVSGSDFNAGRIIDDAVFYNSTAMNVSQIQDFLNAKVPTCDTNGTGSYSYYFNSTTGEVNNSNGGTWVTTTRATYGQRLADYTGDWRDSKAPYVCLKNRTFDTATIAADQYCNGYAGATGESSAAIIYKVAVSCGINPQVLMITLQKEFSLITDDWPFGIQFEKAMGFSCPDNPPAEWAPKNCHPDYLGFHKQVYYGARRFKTYKANPNSYNYVAGRNNQIPWHPNTATCGYSTVYIENQATAALYIYTPYRPNQAALNNLYGTGDGCSSYGVRNFWRLFNDWFGSTYGTIYNGVDYSPVFDADYYLNNNPDIQAAFGDNKLAAFNHFIGDGMNEGRAAKADFNVTTYRNRYIDLRWAFRTNLRAYYTHYATFGKQEGRTGSGSATLSPATSYGGVDYSSVYNYTKYLQNNSDLNQAFGNDDIGALLHFINSGMREGRNASDEFSVSLYRNRYFDLRHAFGNNLRQYYAHYINYGKAEGRTATSSYYGGTSSLNGVNYSLVYDFNTYYLSYGDIRQAFGMDDIAALRHFIENGMGEGRISNATFNVYTYRNNYSDLRNAFGNNLKLYYMHYINYGKAEGRTAI